MYRNRMTVGRKSGYKRKCIKYIIVLKSMGHSSAADVSQIHAMKCVGHLTPVVRPSPANFGTIKLKLHGATQEVIPT